MNDILNYGDFEVISEAAVSCTASMIEHEGGRTVTEFCFQSDRVSEKGAAVCGKEHRMLGPFLL